MTAETMIYINPSTMEIMAVEGSPDGYGCGFRPMCSCYPRMSEHAVDVLSLQEDQGRTRTGLTFVAECSTDSD